MGSRRLFLTTALGAIGAVLAFAAGWPVWRYLSPMEEPGEEERIALDREDVPLGVAHFFRFRGQPAVVLQSSPGVYYAFSAICTHLGCIVQWLPEQREFLCPCHAGRFSPDGRVLSGPPPRPLDSLPVTVVDNRLLIG